MKTDTNTLIDAMRILANEIESEDGVANAAIAEAADRLEQLQTQLSAAKRGMDSASAAGRLMMEKGRKLAAENSPEAIESEREANAVLTAENEQLQAEVERLREDNQLLRRQNGSLTQQVIDRGQERDQLKAELERYSMNAGAADQFRREAFAMRQALGFDKYGDDIAPVDLLNALDSHDAEVIERAASICFDPHTKAGKSAIRLLRDYANQLRQQAKEVQS
jgi:predicted nuclease with TOPRIM domain